MVQQRVWRQPIASRLLMIDTLVSDKPPGSIRIIRNGSIKRALTETACEILAEWGIEARAKLGDGLISGRIGLASACISDAANGDG